MFENNKKGRIQHCERSELRLHFEGTVLPDRSIFMRQILAIFLNTVGKGAMNGLVLLSITIRIQCCLIGFIDGTRTKPELC